MMRVHRWACQERRRTLEDLIRLAEKLRADRQRIDPPQVQGAMIEGGGIKGTVDLRIEKLDRTIADIDSAIERAREDAAAAERELAQVLQMAGGKPVEPTASHGKSQRKSAGMPRHRSR